MTDIIATLKPAQGIQCEQSLLYLFDPNVVISITETTTREWLDAESQNYINTYIKPLLDAYEQEKERQIDAYVEEKQSTIFFDNTNLTGITTAETLNITNKINVSTINNGGDITVPASAGTMALTSDLTNFADKDLSNLTSTGKNIANWSSNVSNCITYISQDIKIEASTLKAGSKAYIPNGAGVFDTVILPNDITISASGSYTRMLFLTSIGSIDFITLNRLYSGATAPTGFTGTVYWYDTTNNVIKTTTDSGNTWNIPNPKKSLPIALFTTTNGTITSIEVFNGFGYMGSTVFALPGVKGLIPDGRNEDGSLKSIEFTIGQVVTQTIPATFTDMPFVTNSNGIQWISYLGEFTTPPAVQQYKAYFNSIENKLYFAYTADAWTQLDRAFCGRVSSNGKITSFTPKTPFHAVDYNDTEFIASQSASSDRYIDLTLAVSGTSYTAQATGWIMFSKIATSAEQYVELGISNSIRYRGTANSNNASCLTSLYVEKGQKFYAAYTTAGNTNFFRFIYAKGSK